MPHPFCIEQLTVSAIGPVEHVTLATELGCGAVGMALEHGPQGDLPGWSLRENPGLRRDFAAAAADLGVAITVGEGPSAGIDPARQAADMDLLAELGARRISAADAGLEQSQAFDDLAGLCEMARDRGMDFVLEFGPASTIRHLPLALQALHHIGEGRAGLLIDSMHFFRAGGTVREIADLDPALIEHVRLSDAARKGTGDYREQARTGRMIPGEGELPLREFVDALPRGQRLGLAVSPRIAGVRASIDEYVAETLMKTRALLVQ